MSAQVDASSVPAPFARLLCGVDGSRASERAVDLALALAGTAAAVHLLAVCHVRGAGPTRMAELGRERAEEALRAARLLARDAGARASTELVDAPDPRRALLQAARSHDVLVLGTHGHSRAEGILLGGTATLALHACEVPVLVARAVPEGRALGERVIVASDGSPGIRRVAEVAGAIAARAGGHTMLLHVTELDRHEVRRELAQEATDLFLATGTEPVVSSVPGRPANAVVAAAAEHEATLLVLGSRGLGGVRALGSVSERVGAAAPCPVLVLRPGDQAI